MWGNFLSCQIFFNYKVLIYFYFSCGHMGERGQGVNKVCFFTRVRGLEIGLIIPHFFVVLCHATGPLVSGWVKTSCEGGGSILLSTLTAFSLYSPLLDPFVMSTYFTPYDAHIVQHFTHRNTSHNMLIYFFLAMAITLKWSLCKTKIYSVLFHHSCRIFLINLKKIYISPI